MTIQKKEPLKIVYLFGAGATHAEIENIGIDPNQMNIGLRIGDVTKRVILKAQIDPDFDKVKMFLKTKNNTNIELLISLFEDNSQNIEGSTESVIKKIKVLIEQDITSILTTRRVSKFSLYRGLLEYHGLITNKETLIGLITLNYDSLLDIAYKYKFGGEPDYSRSSKREISRKSKSEKLPLLKLHGSFDWDSVKILGKSQKIPIIPLGASKNFLRIPYNFIWGRTLELLVESDILRIVGCSLSPNDNHLIDLLFKAHLLKGKPIEIQIISSQKSGEEIRNRYSFFPKIVTSDQLIIPRISNPEKGNIFAKWLKELANVMLTQEQIRRTKYLKRISL